MVDPKPHYRLYETRTDFAMIPNMTLTIFTLDQADAPTDRLKRGHQIVHAN